MQALNIAAVNTFDGHSLFQVIGTFTPGWSALIKATVLDADGRLWAIVDVYPPERVGSQPQIQLRDVDTNEPDTWLPPEFSNKAIEVEVTDSHFRALRSVLRNHENELALAAEAQAAAVRRETERVAEIREWVAKRQIERLMHFTRLANVPSICEHGILSRQVLERLQIPARINDAERLDGRLDCVSLSVSFPNIHLLRRWLSMRQESWAVIELKTDILWEKRVFHFPSNAASTAARYWQHRHSKKTDVERLEAMFAGLPSRDEPSDGLPTYVPADLQAELLVPGTIEPHYFIGILVMSEADLDRIVDDPRCSDYVDLLGSAPEFFNEIAISRSRRSIT